MPTRPDIRDLASNVREAFADADRETLLDILTFVVKEYVAEGPPPMLMHQAETIAELAGMSFAQLVTALQTRLELPELGLFAVDGEQVSVRVGGVMHPLQPGRTPPAAELPRPQAGVRVVETNLMQQPVVQPERPPPDQRASQPGAGVRVEEMPTRQAPPPSRGLSIRGQDAAIPMPASRRAEDPAPTTTAPATPAAAQNDKPTEKREDGGDDAAARFSLLELD
jgi:hypothetical protein